MPLAIHRQVLRKEIPVLLVVSFLLICMLVDQRLSMIEGWVLIIGILLYVGSNFGLFGKGFSSDEPEGQAHQPKHVALKSPNTHWMCCMFIQSLLELQKAKS